MRWPFRRKARNAFVSNDYSYLDRLTRVHGPDYRGVPTAMCPCGCDWLLVPVAFSADRDIASYATHGFCAECGALLTVPTQEPAEVEQWGSGDEL